MALNSKTSHIVYNSTGIAPESTTKPKLGEVLLAKIDEVVEYPGSKKGDFGHWVLTEWVEAKIKQVFEGNGQERR